MVQFSALKAVITDMCANAIGIMLEPTRRFIAQSLSCSSFHRLEMTEILLKGRKTLTHPWYNADIKLVC